MDGDGHVCQPRFWARVHHSGEIEQRPTQAVDLVDDHAIDFARLDIGQQPVEPRSVHVPAGVAAVVVLVGKAPPALVSLAGDEGLAGLALRVQRVELLFQSLFRALARVDAAAHDHFGFSLFSPGHAPAPFFRRLKKW